MSVSPTKSTGPFRDLTPSPKLPLQLTNAVIRNFPHQRKVWIFLFFADLESRKEFSEVNAKKLEDRAKILDTGLLLQVPKEDTPDRFYYCIQATHDFMLATLETLFDMYPGLDSHFDNQTRLSQVSVEKNSLYRQTSASIKRNRSTL